MSASRYQVYQIDFSAVAAGKHVASTKRRIRWRFGFPNKEALEAKQTGQACRGEEHEVVIVWSITSGKRQIVMDGKEVHFSSSRTGQLDHSWTSRGNHVYKVVCHATPPVQAIPGFRQYDLMIDGQSFFSMPKVYELGLRGGVSGSRTPGVRSGPPPAVKVPNSTAEEEADLQRAIRASLAESKHHFEKKTPAQPASQPPTDFEDMVSLGMGDPTNPGGYDNFPGAQSFAAAPTAPYQHALPAAPYHQTPPEPYQQTAQPTYPPVELSYPTSNAGALSYPALPYQAPTPAADQSYNTAPAAPYYPPAPGTDPVSYPAPALPPAGDETTLLADNYTSAPATATAFDAYEEAAPADDPFAPKPPTHSDIANGIMSAYGPTSPGPAPAAETVSPDAGAPPAAGVGGETPQQNSQGLTMLKFEEEEPLNPFDAALKHLVNVDHIDQPATAHLKAKVEQEHEVEEKVKKMGKSKGLPPAATNVVGNQATLAQIGEVKEKKGPSKTVMNAPPQLFSPQAQQAGMMVVYGDTSQQNGPPPLQQQGFGVGYQQQRGYGY